MVAKYSQSGEKIINDSANITFMCPNCNDTEISRSRKERELSKTYECSKCGFIGP